MKLSEFILNIGQPVPYYPALAKMFGVKAAVFLCRFAWWHGRQADSDGWIFKTQDEITDETGMSQKEQDTARKILKAASVIEERIDRLNHRQFYRVNFDALNAEWDKWLGRFPETNFGSFGKPTLGGSSKPTLGGSSTTEDTQKTLNIKPLPLGESVEIPESLKTEEFESAWKNWIAYRKEIGKPLKPIGLRQQLKTFEEIGVARSIAGINHTIFKGYQGFFEPNEKGKIGNPANGWEKNNCSPPIQPKMLNFE